MGDGRTLSVVNAMAKKSPVIITMTISMGVQKPRVRSWTSPIASKSTCTIFLRTEFSV